MNKSVRPLRPSFLLLLFVLLSVQPLLAGGVNLQCTSERYAIPDTVIMVLTNDTDSTLIVWNRPGFLIRAVDTGDTIQPNGGYPVEWTLGPHRAARMGWDQRDVDWHLAGPGSYEAFVDYGVMPGDLPGGRVIADFEIYDPLPIRAMSWGRLKWESKPR